ncbi:antirestriction protein ArdA [Deinococcus sp. S9]|uniref:antirestriction protein ArdA n=1 Tax=Deinococcus sp. S9 TaxID=2545754 RepID=UPI001054A8D3|nr:antirestriction protein ArdA [Deinococcus sp. S9]TDE87416.1 antirestriction protein ArdA [Deinococcus sp. S9]
MSNDTPAVFIAPILAPSFGAWVKVDSGTDPDDLHARGREIVRRFNREYPEDGPAEEYAVVDSEGFAVRLGETADFEYVVWLATLTEEAGDDVDALRAWIENQGAEYTLYDNGKRREVEEVMDSFRDDFLGVYDDVEAYVYQYVEDTGLLDGVSETIKRYFDYKAFARDAELSGDIWTVRVPGGLAIFSNH